MQRNKNLEAVRAFAISGILFYHYSVVTGWGAEGNIRLVLELLCQICMLSFFLLSGAGSYFYLDRDAKPLFKIWYPYVKRRFAGVAPLYYFSIILILLTTKAGLLSLQYYPIILANLTFTQNIFLKDIGSFNGVTWTLALFMQFYCICPVLYVAVKRWGYKTCVFTCLMAISSRFFFDSYTNPDIGDVYYVYVNIRQLITTIDIFCIGMLMAREYKKRSVDFRWRKIHIPITAFAFSLVFLFFYIATKLSGTLFLPTSAWTYIWETIIGIALAIVYLLFLSVPYSYTNFAGKVIQFMASIEYPVYLFHMILNDNLQSSEWYQDLKLNCPFALVIFLFVIATTVGYCVKTMVKPQLAKDKPNIN